MTNFFFFPTGRPYSKRIQGSNRTVPNLNLTTIYNVTRDSFPKHIKRLVLSVASSVNDTDKMTIQVTPDRSRTQEFEVHAEITLDAVAGGKRWGRIAVDITRGVI